MCCSSLDTQTCSSIRAWRLTGLEWAVPYILTSLQSLFSQAHCESLTVSSSIQSMVAFLKDPSGPPLWEENPEAKDVVHIETEKVGSHTGTQQQRWIRVSSSDSDVLFYMVWRVWSASAADTAACQLLSSEPRWPHHVRWAVRPQTLVQ